MADLQATLPPPPPLPPTQSPIPTPPGWYPEQGDPSSVRYWDGAAWTEHKAPLPVAPSGYLGLVSLVFFGVPGPFAIATGVLGLRQIARHPGLNGKVRAWVGIVFGVLGTVWLGLVIVVLASG